MDLQLRDKQAFISGSTAGIGFAIARWLLKEDATVIINGRSQDSIEQAKSRLQAEFPEGKISSIRIDFSNLDQINDALPTLSSCDILINNVGIYESKSFYETMDDSWYHQFEVNVMSGVRLSRYCLPKMLERNWGRIIFISSECASIVPSDMIAYSMTKASMHSVSRGLAELCRASAVTVNTVMPGSTLTEGASTFLENLARTNGQTKEQVAQDFFSGTRTSSLIERFASVDEIASTICYLASPLSSATNGSVIKIEGGSTGGIM